MVRSPGAMASVFVASHTARRLILLVGLAGVVTAALVAARSPAAAAAVCTRAATPATLGSQVSAAAAGETICLASGDYGTWSGTNKAITLQADAGASPQMQVNFGNGDAGFTLDGMTGMGGQVTAGARDFTIRNSTFTDTINIEATNANILLERNSHDWEARYSGGSNAKIFVWNEGGDFSGVTVQYSSIRNGDLDGVHLGGGAGINVLGNLFASLCDRGTNHTDNLQFEGGEGGRIAGNWVVAPAGCDTQGITSYDGETNGVVIEDNVIDIRRPWGIELYADRNSIVRHNTLRYYPASSCNFNTTCGRIDINRKPQDPAGSGTEVYDNLTTSVSFTNGSTGTAHHNVSGQNARFVGPLDTFLGFRLAPDSPVGLRAASDGLDVGSRFTIIPLVGPAPGATPPAPSPSARVSTGLVASYTFGERRGRTVIDRSGSGNRGTLRGARRSRAGRRGRVLLLRGRGDHLHVRDSPSLDLSTAMTLEAWVRPNAPGGRRSVIMKRRSRGVSYALLASSGNRRAGGWIRTTEHRGGTAARLPLRRWSHLAATYDGSRLRLYVNGRLRSARRIDGPIVAGRGPLKIGAGFKGKIDDVRIWRTALPGATLRARAR